MMNWVEYDIYEMLPSGSRLWRDSAATLEHAKVRLSRLSAKDSATFAIYHAGSGKLLDPAAPGPYRTTRYRGIGKKSIESIPPGFANKFKKLVFSLRNGFFPTATES